MPLIDQLEVKEWVQDLLFPQIPDDLETSVVTR